MIQGGQSNRYPWRTITTFYEEGHSSLKCVKHNDITLAHWSEHGPVKLEHQRYDSWRQNWPLSWKCPTCCHCYFHRRWCCCWCCRCCCSRQLLTVSWPRTIEMEIPTKGFESTTWRLLKLETKERRMDALSAEPCCQGVKLKCSHLRAFKHLSQSLLFTQSELIEPVLPQAAQLGIHFYYISFTTRS